MAVKQRQSVSAKMRSIQNKSTLDVNLKESGIVVPTDQQARLSQTIQTHNAVSVAISGTSTQPTWTDCEGFFEIAVTLMNDASTSSTLELYWSHDGITTHGTENVLTNANKYKVSNIPIKARYLKVNLQNADATIAHIMSAWVYLKA
jgi:hypothetical protein